MIVDSGLYDQIKHGDVQLETPAIETHLQQYYCTLITNFATDPSAHRKQAPAQIVSWRAAVHSNAVPSPPLMLRACALATVRLYSMALHLYIARIGAEYSGLSPSAPIFFLMCPFDDPNRSNKSHAPIRARIEPR